MKHTILWALVLLCTGAACSTQNEIPEEQAEAPAAEVVVEAEDATGSSASFETRQEDPVFVAMDSAGWLSYDVTIPTAGRYRVQVIARTGDTASVWLEDYIGNPDGRTYNVTGSIPVAPGAAFSTVSIDGSPFDAGVHPMKLHLAEGAAEVDKIIFTLIRPHQPSPETLTQQMDGDEWVLVWSDEFDGETLDTTKWTYDIGNWAGAITSCNTTPRAARRTHASKTATSSSKPARTIWAIPGPRPG